MECTGDMRDSALCWEASKHFRGGHITAARELLSDPRLAGELIEAARFAFHAADYAASEAFSRRAAVADDATEGQRALARVMRDCVRELSGAGAEDTFDIQALQGAGPLFGEIVYFVALLAFYQRKLEAADTWLRSHEPADPALRARYLNLRGIIAGAREHFLEQAHLTRQSIDILRTEARDSVTLLVASAHILAALVREVPFVGGAALLATIEREVTWTEDLGSARFHIIRSLAWANALESRFVPGMQLLLKALPLARTPILRVYAYLDQATIALFAGGDPTMMTAKAAFALADEIASEIDWLNVHDETIAVLPVLAQVAVDLDPERARVYCELAQHTAGNIEPRWLLAHGTRLRAFIHEASALTYDADTERSTREAKAAFDQLDAIGYGWRAGRMAIHLFRLTGDLKWRDRAEALLRPYGDSPFTRVLASLNKLRKRLTARERQVLVMLQQRRTREEIAAALGITENTVRVYIGGLHYAFGVNRTAKLLDLLDSA